MAFRTGNPALRGEVFERGFAVDSQSTMTIQGTVNKSLLLLAILVIGAVYTWQNVPVMLPFLIPAVIVGFILAMVTVFKKTWAPVTSPIYALVEGVVLGLISAIFEKSYPGIVMQAVALTFGTLFCLLIAYKSRMIKVTDNLRLGIVAATGGIAVIYLISLVMGFFGKSIPLLHSSGPWGIAISVFIVAVAAFNLVLDFDFIERGAEAGAPKYMEWYGAFGLMVTLIWLYLEILRLLAKTRR